MQTCNNLTNIKKEGHSLPSFFYEFNFNDSCENNNLDWVYEKIQEILNNCFSDSHTEKKRIKRGRERLNFACPYCRDSHNNPYKKRGNLYIDTNMYKCFNCGIFKSIKNFFKDYNIDTEKYGKYFVCNKNFRNNKSYNILINNIKGKTIEETSRIWGLEEPDEHIKKYLLDRCQNPFNECFKMNKNRKELWILNIYNSTVIGAICRKFGNFNIKYVSKTYRDLFGEENDIIEDYSLVFGLDKIDFNKNITILEGPLDSFLLPNSISFSGIKNYSIDFLNVRWLYDNDERGRNESLKKIRDKQFVFLWNKYIKENNIKGNIKDYTDLCIYCKKENIPIPNIENYFSNNYLDAYEL